MTQLLSDIFNYDFSGATAAKTFHARFFGKTLTSDDLRKTCNTICASHVELGGKKIPAVLHIKGNKSGGLPFAILAQLHGNEPAGLAGILLAMALAEVGKLERDVIGIVGNPLAAQQYFAHWQANPKARQETRDAYRCGLDKNDALLPDMNRIPVDFQTRNSTEPHIKRAQELFHIGQHISGIVDIHSARGDMLCITDHKHDKDLKDSPIRSILTGLAEAISAHASATVAVQTLKTILVPLPNIESQTGIEAGRHEAPQAPEHAASFTLSLLHTLGLTKIAPYYKKENGIFERFHVQPRITFGDLIHGPLRADDQVYMAKACDSADAIPTDSDRVIIRKKDGSFALQTILQYIVNPTGELAYAVCQYEEMEPIAKNQIVAVAVPSGAAFKTSFAFSGIFLSKSAALYEKDPAVGPWPVAADKISSTKFCYPCEVGEMKLSF